MAALPKNGTMSSSQAGACGGCRLVDRCAGDRLEARGPFRGVSLVVASLLYFLLPAVLALVGAAIAGHDAVGQLLGGATGLLLGMIFATAVAHRYVTDSPDREACFEPR